MCVFQTHGHYHRVVSFVAVIIISSFMERFWGVAVRIFTHSATGVLVHSDDGED